MERSAGERARVLGAVLTALLLAGCAGLTGTDEPGDVALVPVAPPGLVVPPVTPPSLPSAPSTPEAATTLSTIESPTSPPTTVPEAPCGGAPALPVQALEVSELAADLDRDGVSDLLRTYALATADGPLRWRVRLELASGEATDLELIDAYGPVRPLGAVELDPTRAPIAGREVIIVVGLTEYTSILGFLGVDERGCGFRFGDGLGNPATAPVGDAGTRRAGLRCELVDGAQVLVQRTAESDDGQTFTTYDARLQRVTTNLIPSPSEEGIATLDGPSLFGYSIVDCPGISV